MRAARWASRRAAPLGITLPAAAAGACGVVCDKSGGRGEFAVCRRVRAREGRGRQQGRVRSHTRAERERHNAGTRWMGRQPGTRVKHAGRCLLQVWLGSRAGRQAGRHLGCFGPCNRCQWRCWHAWHIRSASNNTAGEKGEGDSGSEVQRERKPPQQVHARCMLPVKQPAGYAGCQTR